MLVATFMRGLDAQAPDERAGIEVFGRECERCAQLVAHALQPGHPPPVQPLAPELAALLLTLRPLAPLPRPPSALPVMGGFGGSALFMLGPADPGTIDGPPPGAWPARSAAAAPPMCARCPAATCLPHCGLGVCGA